MKIVCISDQHGRYDQVVPECDLLILGGDQCLGPNVDDFYQWLEAAPAEDVVAIGGNMDFMISTYGWPRWCRGHYLEDSMVEIQGRRVWGSPWTPDFTGAWNASEDVLADRYARIPSNIDILVSHGPPYGVLDSPSKRGKRAKHVGSMALLATIQMIEPELVVCGHIHASYGVDHLPADIGHVPTKVVNAAVADGKAPIVVNLP